METIHWSDHFYTGIDEVDEQHHTLVNLTNQLCELVLTNSITTEDMTLLLDELVDYTRYHFKEEEQLTVRVGIDRRHREGHKEEHRQFIDHVLVLVKSIDGTKPHSAKELLEFLTRWLVFHILGSDQNMARQIFAMERDGLKADEAFASLESENDGATEILLDALNGLFKQLTIRNRDLSELNAHLEEKVKERTVELQQANMQLKVMAMTDALTELPNRRHALAHLEYLWVHSVRQRWQLSCMMVDADDFKQINDNYGHDAGDVVLQTLGRTLKGAVRNDDMVCRLGGDEFLILCPDTDFYGIMTLAESIREKVAELKVRVGKCVWYGSISVGTATKTSDMIGIEQLIKAADDGVYRAKDFGKNCVQNAQFGFI